MLGEDLPHVPTDGAYPAARRRGDFTDGLAFGQQQALAYVRGILQDAGYCPLVTGEPEQVPGLIDTHRPDRTDYLGTGVRPRTAAVHRYLDAFDNAPDRPCFQAIVCFLVRLFELSRV